MDDSLYLTKTLDELDPPAWDPPLASTGLVKTCHELRGKAIGEFGTEDLRVMIGQGIGLPFLIPLALDVLEGDPLAEGDYYPGDLLRSVLSVSSEFWVGKSEWHRRVGAILAHVNEPPDELRDAIQTFHSHTA